LDKILALTEDRVRWKQHSETLSAGCTSVKGKIWVIYRKFSGKLLVIYGNGNIPNLTGNFRTLDWSCFINIQDVYDHSDRSCDRRLAGCIVAKLYVIVSCVS